MIRLRVGVLALVVAGAVTVLAGCAPAVHPSAHGTSRPAATPSTSAVPSPSPSPSPTPAEITIGPDGIGPLVPGQDVPNTPATAALIRRDPTGCNSDSNTGAWVAVDPTYANAIIVATDHGQPYGRIYSLGTFSPVLKTTAGVGVDDTLAQLQAAYPHFDSTRTTADSTLYVLNGTAGHLIFEVGSTAPSAAGLLQPGEAGHIVSIRSEPLSAPVESIMNTDGYSNCHG